MKDQGDNIDELMRVSDDIDEICRACQECKQLLNSIGNNIMEILNKS